MQLQPCHFCPLRQTDCSIRAEKRAQLKGSGMSMARFSCATFENEFRAGRRVAATIRAATFGRYDDDGYRDATVPATVLAGYERKSRRVLIWPDVDQHERLPNMRHELKFASLLPWNLRPLDEPDNPARVQEWREWCDAQDAAAMAASEDW